MKIVTWNVNGIRARQAQVQEFIEREQPDVLCLQEIKASTDQLPVWLCDIEGYWCYWHGGKGYSGVGLHVRKATWGEQPAFRHPEFDYEHRIVTAQLPLTGTQDARPGGTHVTIASIYVPNGGEGNVTVVHQDSADKYTVIATVTTFPGAKTITVDPTTHTAYLFQPERGPAPPPVPGAPPPEPGRGGRGRGPQGPVIAAWFVKITS